MFSMVFRLTIKFSSGFMFSAAKVGLGSKLGGWESLCNLNGISHVLDVYQAATSHGCLIESMCIRVIVPHVHCICTLDFYTTLSCCRL